MELQYPNVSEAECRLFYREQDHAQGRKILRVLMWLSFPLMYIDFMVFGDSRLFQILSGLRIALFAFSFWMLHAVARDPSTEKFEKFLYGWAILALVVQLMANALCTPRFLGYFFLDAWLCLVVPVVLPLRLSHIRQIVIGFFVCAVALALFKTEPRSAEQLSLVAVLLLSVYAGQSITSFLFRYRSRLLSAELELQRKENTDAVTGVANRREFLRVADNELQRHTRLGKPLSLMILDLDQLKQINLSYGPGSGDMVLVEVSKRIARATRNYDCLARYGTEAFSVLLPEAPFEVAKQIAARTRSTIVAMPVAASGKQLRVSATVGVITMVEGDTLESMLRRAEDALNTAKHAAEESLEFSETING